MPGGRFRPARERPGPNRTRTGPWPSCPPPERRRRARGRTAASRRATSAPDLNPRSGWNSARIEVCGNLALHALECVVDGLRVAVEAPGDLLVRAAVEVQGQDRALELGEGARQAADEAVELLGGDDLDRGVVNGRPWEDVLECLLSLPGARRRLRERDVLVERCMLV